MWPAKNQTQALVSARHRIERRWDFIEEQRAAQSPVHQGWLALLASVRPKHALAWRPGRRLPTPVLPAALSVRLPKPASALILDLIAATALHERVSRIFERSVWQRVPRLFETIEVEGKPAISGSDGDRFGFLPVLAHEVGHCLFEERHGFGNLRSSLYSEACAFIFEDALTRAALPLLFTSGLDRALSLWRGYLLASDDVIDFFSALETFEVTAGRPAFADLPDPRLLAARHSYIDRVGLQWVYGFAAARRARSWQASACSLPELLQIAEKGSDPCVSRAC